MSGFDSSWLKYLLEELNEELKKQDKHITLNIYGGCVMCLEYKSRLTTDDIDVYSNFGGLYSIVEKIAEDNKIQKDWLNESVLQIVMNDLIRQDMYDYNSMSNLRVDIYECL